MYTDFCNLLGGGDLRSIGIAGSVAASIKNQVNFDELFECNHTDRRIAMRAADAIEKVTVSNPEYLINHKSDILKMLPVAKNKEIRWHLALLVPRLELDKKELKAAWQVLRKWAQNPADSKIVRVNAVQALYELSGKSNRLAKNLKVIFNGLTKENIPSISARIRKLTDLKPI